MRLDVLPCQAATASLDEGLLYMLGAGITEVRPSRFPARLPVKLGVLLWLEDDAEMGRKNVEVSVLHNGTAIGTARAAVTVEADDPEDQQRHEIPEAPVPIAFDLDRFHVDGPGPVEIRVAVEEGPSRTVYVLVRGPAMPDTPATTIEDGEG